MALCLPFTNASRCPSTRARFGASRLINWWMLVVGEHFARVAIHGKMEKKIFEIEKLEY